MEILVGGSWGIWRVTSRCFRRRLRSQRKKAVIRTRNSTKKIVEYIDNLRYFEFSGFSMMKTSGVSEFSKIQHFHSSVLSKLPRALSITVTNGDNASRFVWIIWIFFVLLSKKLISDTFLSSSSSISSCLTAVTSTSLSCWASSFGCRDLRNRNFLRAFSRRAAQSIWIVNLTFCISFR